MNARIALAATAVATLIAPMAALAPPAQASHGGRDGVRNSGACSQGAHWKLKAKPDDGRLEVEGEVDSNRSGQVWHWVIKHNGSVSAKGRATTAGRSGSFSVERRMADLAGKDHFTFRAKRAATGEVCRGRVTI